MRQGEGPQPAVGLPEGCRQTRRTTHYEADVAIEDLVHVVVAGDDDRPSRVVSPANGSVGKARLKARFDGRGPARDTDRAETGCTEHLQLGRELEALLDLVAARRFDDFGGLVGHDLLQVGKP